MTPATSDRVESGFGVLSDIINSTDNLSLHSAGSMSTWRINRTAQWMDSMFKHFSIFATTLLRLSQSAGIILKKESDQREVNAKKAQLKRVPRPRSVLADAPYNRWVTTSQMNFREPEKVVKAKVRHY